MAQIHPTALGGFDSDPDRYERSRPSYPPTAVSWLSDRLGLGPGRVVVDVAAGTGKLTRLLTPTGARVLAVEPVDGMRRVLSRVVPAATVVAGVAEALPFATSAVDAITIAQAFHWFDREAAFAEFARVLRPGGGVGVMWNVRDRTAPWLDAVWKIMDRVESDAPWHRREREGLPEPDGFDDGESTSFRHVVQSSVAGMLDRVASVSHVAVLPESERAALLEEVRDVLRAHGAGNSDDALEVPYRVEVYYWRRTG